MKPRRKTMNDENFPPQYILCLIKLDPNEPHEEKDVLDGERVETYVFDLIKEGDLLVASCNEHHIIVSAPTWKQLEPKINSAFQKAVGEKHGI